MKWVKLMINLYKTGSSSPVVVYRNGGFGLNFKNASLMLKIEEKTRKMKALDEAEKRKKATSTGSL